MKVKIKKLLDKAVTPKYSVEGDAGLDLTAIDSFIDKDCNFCYNTGIAIEIPKGYVGLLFPRSSICKYDLLLTNSVGVIDSNYRGEIIFKFSLTSEYYLDDNNIPYFIDSYVDEFSNTPMTIYNIGDRVGQLIIMPYPNIEFEEVEELSETERGAGGYGSTGL